MSILFYRRPDYVSRPAGPLNLKDCQKYVERTKNNKSAIPPELSFERVVNNETLPPASLTDFMNYLIYVAHDAETLQFYLWLQDYTKRFNALRKEEQALSPEWKATAAVNETKERNARAKASVSSLNELTTSDKVTSNRMSELIPGANELFADPPISSAPASDYESFITKSVQSQKTIAEMTDDANAMAGLKWQAFTCQPFRQEIAKVIANYLAPNAPRELNISYKDRTAVLHALQHTTHPSAFQILGTIVESTLRGQLHPNFIRWSICNGNKPKIFFVRTMGVIHIALGLLIALLLTLSRASRWYRILSAPVTLIGAITMVAAYKGLCVILHANGGVRNVKPWEDSDSYFSDKTCRAEDEEATLALSDVQSIAKSNRSKSTIAPEAKRPKSFDTFGSANTFADEPWVSQYEKRPLMEKIMEKNTWVQDESIRSIQNMIIRQSQFWGVVFTVVVTAAFVALPPGNFY
ncbi:uncharacterized protein PV09_05499 [Verruconis gallopava]|uniref:RGS domain-containing protein n=1 Tax=Verruconis gallopava TaxID=253628 RepID=A0A0D1XLI2_9PEZI|nr:uncharacterized protein PV09_05499 [Verruconis gallopava]KIW03286.1 hypothetical protein PV09_05499 [Verruconis gallopava]